MRPVRLLLLVIGLFALALCATPALAAVCPGVELTRPTDGAHVSSDTTFRWSHERSTAVRREWVLVGVTEGADGSIAPSGEAAREEALPFKHKPKSRLQPGSYNWFVVFYDARGNVLCTSPVGSFSVGKTRGPLAGAAAGLSSPAGASAIMVVVRGNYVVVLFGSPYLGTGDPYDELLADGVNDYDASGLDLSRYTGVTIHGNDFANLLTGSAGADIIFGYAGNDILNGGDGDDILHGGDESCTGNICVHNANGDHRLGDTLNGGAGNDILYGGDESCSGNVCNLAGTLGDTLDGGPGNDILYGGNESCTGFECNRQGTLGDTLDGGPGDDTLHGGDESCTGEECNHIGTLGDTLDGGPGDDTGTGGTETAASGGGNVGDIIVPDPGDTNPITQ